jgi:hypothetical protein
MECSKCMAENAAAGAFVPSAGRRLPSACPARGLANEPPARFSAGCGKPIGEAAAPAPTIVPTAPRIDSAERRPTETHFHVGAFDQAAGFRPTRHIFAEDRLPWLHLGSG